MTRIITITSGSPGVGKTHLAVNLALELVRRGRQVGLYHMPDGDSPVDRFIDVQHIIDRPQAGERGQDDNQVTSRGYLGVDILSSEIPLSRWPVTGRAVLDRYVRAMDVEGGYDDFIIDTSGMGAREQLACCLAAPLVVMVVTPESRTQAEAFAMLRILSMNGFSGMFRVLVNRVPYAMDAQDIQKTFDHEISRHLGLESGLPWNIVEDSCVSRSERYRQAFSAVFPDSEAAAGIVVLADNLDAQDMPTVQISLQDWWQRFIDYAQAPIMLPGDIQLEMEPPEESAGEGEAGTGDAQAGAGRQANRQA